MDFVLFSIIIYISSTLCETSEDIFLPYPKIRNISSKLRKRQGGDGGYLEQCEIVNFGAEELGTVNVLAFFDATWQYSHRQAALLKELAGRFRRSGMIDITFFVINSMPSTIFEETEIGIEEETWKAIYPSEPEDFINIETSLESLKNTLGPEIHLIQDNPEIQIWKRLHVSRNQIVVVDSCGKLTYQVIVPWSIMHFPYVKAAILSTFKDEPCRPCEESNSEENSTFVVKEDTTDFIKNSKTTLDSNERISNEAINNEGSITTIGNDYSFSEEIMTTTTPTPTTTTDEISVTETTTESIFINDEELYEGEEKTIDATIETTTKTTDETTTVQIETAGENENYETKTEQIMSTEIGQMVETQTTTEGITEFFTSTLQRDLIRGLKIPDYINNYQENWKNSEKSSEAETEILKTTYNLEDEGRDNLENIISQDLEKFPNIRSLSSSKNKIIPDQESENINGENSNILPIRIIMKAPHLDIYENSLTKHDYLILMTNDTHHHQHYDLGIKIESMDKNIHDFEKNTDIWRIGYSDLVNKSGELNVKIDYENTEDSRRIKKIIFEKDESPGLYREVADYWINDDIEDSQDAAFIDQDDKNYDIEKDESRVDVIFKPANYNNDNNGEEIQQDKNVANAINDEQEKEEEEEAKSKLIAHYSKLLPWIYYVLN